MYSHLKIISYLGLLVGSLLLLSSCATTPNSEEGHDITIRDPEQIQETAEILFIAEAKVDIEKTSTGKYNVRVTIENTVGGQNCEAHLDDIYSFFSSITPTFATQLENIVVIHNYPHPYITGSDKAEERADVIQIGFKGITLQKITWLEPVESVGMGKEKFLDFYNKHADSVYIHQFCEDN